MEGRIGTSMSGNIPRARIDSGQLCESYYGQVRRFAEILTRGTIDEADDLAQDVMISVIRRSDTYDSRRGSLDRWLWGIALNRARDRGRAATRRGHLLDRLLTFDRPVSPDVESVALDRLRDDVIRKQMQLLSRRDRTLLSLRFGSGLETREMSAVLGVSEPAVRKATRRALTRLARRLELEDLDHER